MKVYVLTDTYRCHGCDTFGATAAYTTKEKADAAHRAADLLNQEHYYHVVELEVQ